MTSIEFEGLTDKALDFYQSHGFVVLSPVFSNEEMDKAKNALDSMRERFAEEMGLNLEIYDDRICQWRDLDCSIDHGKDQKHWVKVCVDHFTCLRH